MAATETLPMGLSAESTNSVPQCDPTYLYDLAERMFAVDILSAAVGHLHLFEHLHGQPSTLDQLCEELGLAARPASVMLTMFHAQGLIDKDADGVYKLSSQGIDFLLPGSRYSLAACYGALKDRPACLAVLQVLKTGASLGWQGDEPQSGAGIPEVAESSVSQQANPDCEANSDWMSRTEGEAFAEYFLEVIDSRNRFLADRAAKVLDLRGCRKLLDIGGGSGVFTAALARANEHLACSIIERPPVDGVARRAMERQGLSGRVDVIQLNMMEEPLPKGYDLHFFSNVVHDWDEETVYRLFQCSYQSLRPGGRIVIHDSILGAEQDNRPVAEYSALLASYTSGRCYAADELRYFLHQAGFVAVTLTPTAVHRSLMAAIRPFDSAEEIQ
jgi:SAM-dependent methyltransferase